VLENLQVKFDEEKSQLQEEKE
jgi:hypothetical protein